jgi:hypothetical protein
VTNLSNMGYPFVFNNAGDDANLKLPHDRYDVYVNGDFVGHKVLLTQSDKIEDVASYLKRNGFGHFDSSLDGDHYNIEVHDYEDGKPDGNAARIKRQLDVYLSIR